MKILLLFAIGLISTSPGYSQLPLSKDSVQHIVSHSPAFSIYRDNYFIAGTTVRGTPSQYNSDAKFQFSFKQRLANKPLLPNTFFYLTYTQKSFWDIYLSSSPFKETNYNPGIQMVKFLFEKDQLQGLLAFSLEHESNGRDSTNSKSWNFVSASYTKIMARKLAVSVKLWLPFFLSDNPDLTDYIGYGEAQLQWTIKEDKWFLDMTARKGDFRSTRGSLQANLSFRPSMARNQYLVLQWWQGYAESLIDYKQSNSMLRLGIILRPTFYRFY